MLQGKKAIVTGSTSGIGLGILHVLAEHGCDVVMNGFGDAAEIEAARAQTENKFNVKCHFIGADLSTAEGCEQLINDAEAALGGLDILINNAGIQFTSAIEEFPVARWDAIIAINLSACFHTTRMALPAMRKGGFGRIINIASAHGHVGSEHKVAYVAAKHGVVGMTKVTALETAQENITCNAICPGWVLTPLVQKQIEDRAAAAGISLDEEKIKLLAEKQPSMEFATPEQMGHLAAFLCTDHAAQITGTSQLVDGGWTAR